MAVGTVAPRKGRRKKPSETVPDTPDPIEIAMTAVATGADRHGAARAVLEKHACLIDVQCEREREELAVLRLRRFTRWLILAGVMGLLATLGAAGWAAARSTSLVIEPFEVPPALAQRGLNGRVVSARVLDRLAQLQRDTESMRGEKSYADNWNDDIKVAIPETGISLGDAWRTLKAWLGSETRIGGEVVQTPRGLAISTRAGSLSGGAIEGREDEIDRLIGDAASSIYKVTQPYRYAIALPGERQAERVQILTGLTGDPSMEERKWAYSGLSVTYRALGDLPRAAANAQRALEIDPDLLPALGNLFHAQMLQGDFEAALLTRRRFEAAYSEAASGEYDERISLGNRLSEGGAEASILRDPSKLRGAAAQFERLGTTQSWSTAANELRAQAAALDHDHSGALARLGSLPPPRDPVEGASLRYEIAKLKLFRAADHADASEVATAVRDLDAASLPQPGGSIAQGEHVQRRAWIALALARTGRAAEGAAIAAPLPANCYDCLRARGWAALSGGSRRAALSWFRAAVHLAPSVPAAYVDIGDLLLAAGQSDQASQQFALAAHKSPRWADPLQRIAAAEVKAGRLVYAERSYARAAALAPRWGRLHLEWADTLWRLRRREEARTQLTAAVGMDLSARDRILLRRMVETAEARS